MIVLAIDTSHEFGSLALASDEGTMEEVLLHEPGGFSGTLFEQIDSLLKRHRFSPDRIDIFAAAAGPGSFTGVRIGLTAVKALAEAHGKPCFGVSNLEAMARAGTDLNRAVFLDARRGEVYAAVFGSDPAEEVVASFSTWIGTLSDIQEFLAFDFTPFEPAIAQSRFSGALKTRVPRAISGSIAALALEKYGAGELGDAATLDANYVRRSDAELLWKDRL